MLSQVCAVQIGFIDGITMDVFKGCDKILMIYNAVSLYAFCALWVMNQHSLRPFHDS